MLTGIDSRVIPDDANDSLYFDEEIETGDLIGWETPVRWTNEAYEWLFAEHDQKPDLSVDEALAARCGCL